MFSYRDTMTLDPHTPTARQEEVDGFIREVGFIHGHKSYDSVQFQVDAADLWDLHEKMDELRQRVQEWVTYELNKDCVFINEQPPLPRS